MRVVNANDIKKKGLSVACDNDEATLVTVRGKPRYVVLTVEKYRSLSEVELTLAVAEAQEDYKAGRYAIESVEKHLKRLNKQK